MYGLLLPVDQFQKSLATGATASSCSTYSKTFQSISTTPMMRSKTGNTRLALMLLDKVWDVGRQLHLSREGWNSWNS